LAQRRLAVGEAVAQGQDGQPRQFGIAEDVPQGGGVNAALCQVDADGVLVQRLAAFEAECGKLH
jgi:hypothetical protein